MAKTHLHLIRISKRRQTRFPNKEEVSRIYFSEHLIKKRKLSPVVENENVSSEKKPEQREKTFSGRVEQRYAFLFFILVIIKNFVFRIIHKRNELLL